MTIPRTVIGCSVVVLVLSALLGAFHDQSRRALSAGSLPIEATRITEKPLSGAPGKERERVVDAVDVGLVETRAKSADTEVELIKAQTENNDLQAKVKATESQIAQLQQLIKNTEAKPVVSDALETPLTAELQAQVGELRKQLDGAERENALLYGKIKALQERPANRKAKNRPDAGGNPGIRGRVLAVNQAYNFVVLNLGGRQGVEPNTEMLVLRSGSFIGKIRVSSVEPATTIGDIITTSLARGVQVQRGDTVVYAGTNF